MSRIRWAVVVCIGAAAVAGCTSSAGTKSGTSVTPNQSTTASQPTVSITPSGSTVAGKCPIVDGGALDAIVGIHMIDHYDLTQQPPAGSPLAGATTCDFDSGEGKAAKLASGAMSKLGSAEQVTQIAKGTLGASGECPAIAGIGDKAFGCSDEGNAVVIAQGNGLVVVAYRGGKPGGAALLDQAKKIATALLNG